jgi:hypothetical protein
MWATSGQDKRLANETERFREQGTHGRFVEHLVNFGRHVHRALISGETLDVSGLTLSLAAVGTPATRNDADYYAWKAGMDNWLGLLGDVLELLKAMGKPATLSTGDVQALARTLGYPRLLPWLEFIGTHYFEPEAAHHTLNYLESEVTGIIEPFLTRADLLSRIACIAAAVGDAERGMNLLARANANLLGHGYHKDMVLFQVLDAVQASGYRHGDLDIVSFVPLVNVITDVTDGDETDHLPIELSDHLLACRSPNFVSLYNTFIEQGRVTWSETAAGDYLGTCSSNDAAAWALAMSLVEDGLEAAKNYLNRSVEEARRSHPNKAEALEADYRNWLEIDYPPEGRKERTSRQYTEEHPTIEEVPKSWSAEELLENIANGRSDWEWSSRIATTLQDWAAGQNTPSRADMLRIADTLLADDTSWRNARIYDALQQILRRYGENERAFRALIAAQAAGSNWNSYFNEKRHSDARLEVVLSRYRNRLEEYIAASAVGNVTSYGAITITPRVVDALARGGKVELAAAITDDFVAFAHGLSGDLTLQKPAWAVGSEEAFDGLDLLLPRLGHLIPATRVRAACALADLAAQDARVPERVTLWLERESLEARQLSALMTLSLLARTAPASVARLLTRVREKLGQAGLATRWMFNELCRACHLPSMTLPPTWPVTQQIELQQSPGWFERLISHWPGVQGRVKSLTQSRPDFQTRLYHMATSLGLDKHLAEKANEAMLRNQNRGKYWQTFVQPPARDILDTAYQGVLASLVSQGVMRLANALWHAFEGFPIDTSLARLKPTPRPAWLPAPDNNGTLLTWPSAASGAISALLKWPTQDNEIPLALSFQQVQADGKIAWTTTALAFRYQFLGSVPPAREVWSELFKQLVMSTRITSHALDYPEEFHTETNIFRVGDLVVMPLVGRLFIPAGTWTPLSHLTGTFVPLLGQDIYVELEPGENPLTYVDPESDTTVMHGSWWQHGMLSGMYVNKISASANTGFVLHANASFLSNRLAESEWSLGWASHTETSIRQEYSDNERISEHYELHNVSTLIRPLS